MWPLLPTDPTCASPGSIAGATVNGAAVHPAFWTDSYEGQQYGIMSFDASSALGEGSAAGQRRSLQGGNKKQRKKDGGGGGSAGASSLTVCIKLKRRGPCSKAGQFCLDGECVFTVKDKREGCCPTLPLV